MVLLIRQQWMFWLKLFYTIFFLLSLMLREKLARSLAAGVVGKWKGPGYKYKVDNKAPRVFLNSEKYFLKYINFLSSCIFSCQIEMFHQMRHTNMFRYKIINYLVVQESLELLDHLVFLGFLAVQEAPCFLGQKIFSQRHQVDLEEKCNEEFLC